APVVDRPGVLVLAGWPVGRGDRLRAGLLTAGVGRGPELAPRPPRGGLGRRRAAHGISGLARAPSQRRIPDAPGGYRGADDVLGAADPLDGGAYRGPLPHLRFARAAVLLP